MLLIAISLTGCVTAEKQALDAAINAGQLAGVVLPILPDDCAKTARSGVRAGERLDVALIRTDQALSRQNARTRRCAAWYNKVRTDTRGVPE